MAGISYYTEEGLQNLKDELFELKTKGRPDMSKQIGEARDKGDLSENAEYDAAKDAQGMMEMRISLLEGLLGDARVMKDENVDLSKVSILSTVKIKNIKNGMEVKYTLVSEKEANLKMGKISYESPIGKGLMNKKIGEVAEIIAPAGKMEFKVLDITLE
ncbi:MAG: transcription elongation factor GreA [Roseivirga sp.]|jgi:transcription elongation factor GreA